MSYPIALEAAGASTERGRLALIPRSKNRSIIKDRSCWFSGWDPRSIRRRQCGFCMDGRPRRNLLTQYARRCRESQQAPTVERSCRLRHRPGGPARWSSQTWSSLALRSGYLHGEDGNSHRAQISLDIAHTFFISSARQHLFAFARLECMCLRPSDCDRREIFLRRICRPQSKCYASAPPAHTSQTTPVFAPGQRPTGAATFWRSALFASVRPYSWVV
ncbi:hypothetical protein CC80DRAFT_42498 [Byssothecium circinans]|uniref:Uncharacterized protein n=1 Tax=Byssothecium circinans TaxID=147558 RepID=A0A6A5TYC3_9PLEO|nr:hypothetical protein CC80DRAFT_42498 [Byssothecium circinans]